MFANGQMLSDDQLREIAREGADLYDERSLRDYFAGQALAGIQAHRDYVISFCQNSAGIADIADHCYLLADAMIEARKAAPKP